MFPDFIDTNCFLEAYLCILNALIFRKLCKPGVEFLKVSRIGYQCDVCRTSGRCLTYIYISICDLSAIIRL